MEKAIKVTISVTKFLIILACITCLSLQGQKCIQRYNQRESTMIVTQKPTQEATFLAFTMCPHYIVAYKDEVLDSYGITKADYRKGKYLDLDLYEQVTYNLTEVLEKMTITTTQGIFTMFPNEMDEVKVTINHVRVFGKCFSMQLSQEIIGHSVTRIDFLTKMDSFIYMHHPGQFLGMDENTKTDTRTNYNNFLDMSFTMVENSLDREKSTVPCSKDFDFDTCLTQKMHDALLSKFNCTVPFLPKLKGSQSCKDEEKFEEIIGFFDKNIFYGQREYCKIPCNTVTLHLGLLHQSERIPSDGKSYIKFYFKSFINIRKIVYDYTLLSMLAEIGGYTGLLLGASVADLTLLVEQFRKYIM